MIIANDHSSAGAAGAICTGAAAGGRFGVACFLAAAGPAAAGAAAVAAGRDAAADAPEPAVAAGLAAPDPGSGAMMLTAGVEAEVGNSALVGLPVGIDGGSAATCPAPASTGVFHDGA